MGGGKDSGKGKSGSGVCKVFFKNLLYETPEAFLKELFQEHGKVVDFYFFRTSEGKPKGAGACEYDHPAAAKRAVAALNEADVDGRIIAVELEDPNRSKGAKGGKDAGKGKGKDAGKSGTCKVIFSNLMFETPSSFVNDIFTTHGNIKDFFLWRSHDGRSKGSGVCEFDHPAAARRAVAALNGAEVDGRVMTVELEGEDGLKGSKGGKGHHSAIPAAYGKSGGKSGGKGGNCRLFFKNANFDTSHAFFVKLFRKFGFVVNVDLRAFPDGRSKGMGVVEYGSNGDARRALEELKGADVDGRELILEFEDATRPVKGMDKGKGKGRPAPY